MPSTVTVAASPRHETRLRHHQPDGELEDERQEDADEHDQERVADRDERGQDAERGGDQQHRAHREQELDALPLGRIHGASPYAARRPVPGAGREPARRTGGRDYSRNPWRVSR